VIKEYNLHQYATPDQSQIVPALWKHNTKPIQFVLVVNDFGIKYLKKEDLDHLIQTLEKHYDVSVDLKGKEFMKIQLDWDYENRKIHRPGWGTHQQ